MIKILERNNQPNLAYAYTPPAEGKPLIMFCGGYKSDMEGTKALHFEDFCAKLGYGFLRFDYSGHGSSDGKFIDGTIGSWAMDGIDVLEHVHDGQTPVILMGSSMGGWIMFLIARHLPDLIHHMIGIAAAPDFTKDMYAGFTAQQKQALEVNGKIVIPSDYPDPYIMTKVFFDNAAENFVMEVPWDLPSNVHLFQGMEDNVVKPEKAEAIKAFFGDDHVEITYCEEGRHNMSDPAQLRMMEAYLERLMTDGSSYGVKATSPGF